MTVEPNEMMMDLFHSEVEVHSESLTASLLALERDPNAAQYARTHDASGPFDQGSRADCAGGSGR